MPRATSLRGALNRHKGVDYEKERQTKLRKGAEKRKVQKEPEVELENEDEDEESGDDESSNESGHVLEMENGSKVSSGMVPKLSPPVLTVVSFFQYDLSRLLNDSDDDSDDDSENSDGSDAPELISQDQAALIGGGDDNEEGDDSGSDESDDEDEDEDVALSDLESLADEDKEDIIPHQRLTINNTTALEAGLARISLPYSAMPFSGHQSIVAKTTTANMIPDIDDDLQREKVIMQQALEAAIQARTLLKAEGVPFARPVDFFAEMVKSEDQMGRVKGQLVKEATAKKASMEARKLRDLKKRGKKVQVEKEQERARERRVMNDKVESLKRKRQGAPIANETEADMFDIALETEAKPGHGSSRKRSAPSGGDRGSGDRGGDRGGPKTKRQRKDDKFGFGGKKRFSKSGDAASSADMSGFSAKRMKKGGAAAKRPGKSRRANSRA